ncbi:MAG TPA: DUF2752 domain-containing protein [Ilumatobacter sp.]|nr:DUF2752 domain-containing protein [Ilumatobacter sp.]
MSAEAHTTEAHATLAERAGPIAAGVGALAAAGYLAANDPVRSGWFVPCPFRELTGLVCPGCGITRAIHHLLRGDVIEAVRLNLFAPLVVVALGLAWIAWLSRDTFGRPMWRPQVNAVTAPVALMLLAAYGVVRNLT